MLEESAKRWKESWGSTLLICWLCGKLDALILRARRVSVVRDLLLDVGDCSFEQLQTDRGSADTVAVDSMIF